jgi:large subunit ribosomal protein L9
MEVILLQRVEKLGKMGDIVNVRPGFARNFLLPKKVALRATKENISHFEKEKDALEKLNLTHMEEANVLAKRLEGAMVTLIRQASEGGQLYGSVSARDIAEALKQEHVTKNHVKIDHPIKTIGIHAVRIQLHPEVAITLGVNIAMSEDEAKAQAKTLERMTPSAEEESV